MSSFRHQHILFGSLMEGKPFLQDQRSDVSVKENGPVLQGQNGEESFWETYKETVQLFEGVTERAAVGPLINLMQSYKSVLTVN